MTEQKPPREFWIQFTNNIQDETFVYREDPGAEFKPIHVIEYSAFEKLQSELEELKAKTSDEMVKIHRGHPSEWAYKILERERDEYKRIFKLEQKWRLEGEAKLKLAESALEFYADKRNWYAASSESDKNSIEGDSAAYSAGGNKARETLAKIRAPGESK